MTVAKKKVTKQSEESEDKVDEELFEDVQLETAMDVDTSVKNLVMGAGTLSDEVLANAPDPTSTEWNAFILSLFEPEELIDGRPVVAGLRRVAEAVIGPIKSSEPVEVFPVENQEAIHATTVWSVSFMNGQTFGDVADCWFANTDDAFLPFAMATSATRAEARSLRKALKLRSAAAEEMTKKDTAKITQGMHSQVKDNSGEYDDTGGLSGSQKSFIDNLGRRTDINLCKFFKEDLDVSTSKKITRKQASSAIDKLQAYLKDTDTIGSTIQGFNEDWTKE